MEKLRECPFCGGTAKYDIESTGHVMPYHVIKCTECFCSTGWYNSKEDVVDTWNTRASDDEIQGLNSEIVALRIDIDDLMERGCNNSYYED